MESAKWYNTHKLQEHFKPGAGLGEALLAVLKENNAEHLWESLVLTPGAPNYLSPLIPNTVDSTQWFADVARAVQFSFQHLIADIWTQLLVSKRDSKEKPIYLFWDNEIPKPSKVTALAWLLICETWPLQNHKLPRNSDWEELFPPQTLFLPQSTPYGYASNQPTNYACGRYWQTQVSLTGLLAQSMHRDDRIKMETAPAKPPFYRPQGRGFTSYGAHENTKRLQDYDWQRFGAWPHHPSLYFDQNLGGYEIMESELHLEVLDKLRAKVMDKIMSIPGMPSHKSNMYMPSGMWIKNFSEGNIAIRNDIEVLQWTPEGETIQLAESGPLKLVPSAAPKVWWGWSHIGPAEYDPTAMTQQSSASEQWVQAYMLNRKHALEQLFVPASIDFAELRGQSLAERAKLLTRAGRIKKREGEEKKESDFAKAFAKIIKE